MSKSAKHLVAVAVAVLCVVMVALASRHRSSEITPAQSSPPIQAQIPTPTPAALARSAPIQPAASAAPDDASTIPPLPANATSVPDEHLLKLSAMVNLPNAEERRIDRDQWSRALPIARKLVQGPCDCEQRNWLTQFIKMGDDALSGADEDYFRLAAVMRKTARNDKQLESDPAFFAR